MNVEIDKCLMAGAFFIHIAYESFQSLCAAWSTDLDFCAASLFMMLEMEMVCK